MKTRKLLFPLMTILIFSAGANAAETASDATPKQLDQVVKTYVNQHEFSGNVLVASHGKVFFEKSYGIADHATGTPVTEHSRFILASVSKPFVATLALMQAEQGIIALDHSIRDYLPELPTKWGRSDGRKFDGPYLRDLRLFEFSHLQKIRFEHLTPQQLIDDFRDKPLAFTPGSRYSYSNLGYVILGYLVEKMGGSAFADQMYQNIFGWLGMTESGVWGFNDDNLSPRAIGYAWQNGKYVLSTPMDPSIAFADGDVFSTARGLLAFDQALYGSQLLSESTKENMFTPRYGSYGLGFRIKTVQNHRLVYHDGNLVGNMNRFARYIDDELTIILLNNTAAGKVDEISDKIAALMFKQDYVPVAHPESLED